MRRLFHLMISGSLSERYGRLSWSKLNAAFSLILAMLCSSLESVSSLENTSAFLSITEWSTCDLSMTECSTCEELLKFEIKRLP